MLVIKKEQKAQKAPYSAVALSIHFAWSYPTTWEFEVSRVALREKDLDWIWGFSWTRV